MGEWRLFDETSPLEDFNDSHPYLVIESEEQLRTELEGCGLPDARELQVFLVLRCAGVMKSAGSNP